MTASSRAPRRALCLLWIALFAVWFGTLDYRKLIRPDEGRYAEIPREMVASGDWLTPRLNSIKYLEKPPLQYWVMAASYKAFGESEWSTRLWPALTSFLSVLLTAWTGRRLWGAQAGMLSAAILASTLLFVVMSHLLTLDMGLTFFLQVAWTAFLFAQQGDPKSSRRWMWLLWAALALAVLSKGLVALVLCGATLVVHTLLNRDFSPWKKLSPFSGLAIFLAIASPWFIAVSIANPEFHHFFFIHEHFERFLTTAHRRYQPDGYFIYIYAAGALPWTFLLLHALFRSWRRNLTDAFQTQRFLALWVMVTFVFFSISSSKLPPYLLPIFPALALLGGNHLTGLPRRQLLVHLAALAALTIAALAFLPQMTDKANEKTTLAMLDGYLHWLMASSIVLLAAILAAIFFTVKQRKTAAMLILSAGGVLFSFGALLGHENLSLSSSAAHIAARTKPLLPPGVPFYSVQMYEQTLPFYIKRSVTLVNYQSELAFGIRQEPDKWIPDMAEFRQRWATDRDAFAIMQIDTYNKLAAEKLPMNEITRDTRHVIVRKNSSPPISHSGSRGDGCSAAQNAVSASMAGSLLGRPCERASQ